MYDKVANDMAFTAREEAVLAFWKEKDIMNRSWERRVGSPVFTIYDGPPTANGKPHMGHVLTRAIKDIIPRYRSMKGYHVEFKAGWDTHGLPVELEVEKALGINGKDQIEDYGVEAFVHKCKESVWTYKDEWEQMSDRVGYWADMENPYVTFDNNYIESVWWALKEIWKKGLLYEGHKILPYCPRCGTSLSSHEVAQGYKDVKETSIFVRFKVKEEEDTYFAAWTTTPWTLPSNLGLCVNPKADYVLATREEDGKTVRYYVAKDLVEAVLGEEHEVLDTFVGTDLEHKAYEPLFDYAKGIVSDSGKDAWFVTCDDYVTLSEGTGIVHLAPAFGEDDSRVCQRYNMPFVQFVREDGTFPAEVYDFQDQNVMEANPAITNKLEAESKLMKRHVIEHNYPHCWRCDTPLIYYARHSWFIRTTALQDELISNNRSVNWIPDNVKEGRMGNFLENLVDWGLTRERYWGTPLPAWRCPDGHIHIVGSIAELKELSDDCPDDIELHKPYIDQVHLNCPECQQEMKRVPQVIDGWFDSGAMPFAQYHYPFENKEKFDENFPAQFISEAQDQTRGWFYSLLAIGTLVFGRSPFENCIVMGLVQDKDGIKMSKHIGNVVDPWDALNKQGADAVRWHFYSNSQPWLPSRYHDASVSEAQRKFMGTLWNTYSFYVLYANIDKFNPAKHALDLDTLTVMDRWILSRLNTLILEVDKSLDRYDISFGARRMIDFVDELSNWYVRRGRERYWGEEMTEDKVAAYMTLYTVLKSLVLLAAPFVPFITEDIYQNLVRRSEKDAPESVHFYDYPVADETLIDKDLEEKMAAVLEVITMGRAARNQASMKNRQPLARILVSSPVELTEQFSLLVTDELNIKRIEFIRDDKALQDYSFKPQLRTLGRRFGKNLPELSKTLTTLDGQASFAALEEDGFITVEVAGALEKLGKDDLLIETVQVEGFQTEQNRDYTVALDLHLTGELIDEGYVREIISKIQTMRKESDFEVQDRIRVYYEASSALQSVFENYGEMIASEVLALELLALDKEDQDAREWSINGESCRLKLERA